MPLFRKRSRTPAADADPRGRSREADEAIAGLLGLPMPSVTAITDILRGPVADLLCQELPGVEHSTAPRTLLMTSAAGAKMPTLAVQSLRPDLAYGHAAAAALPSVLLYALTLELTRRYDVAHPAAPFEHHRDAGPPDPPASLRNAYAELRFRRDDALLVQRTTADAMARASLVGDPNGRAWGAWALVGAVVAVNAHQHVLPAPGRPRERPAEKRAGASAAGFAFQFGRAVLAATAADMVEAAERA
jgi:hypothetical protein